MAILKIARMGHPVLRRHARPLTKGEILSPKVQQLIEDMRETMRDASGIGLAAPQVHESIQLAIIEFTADNERYPQMGNQELIVVCNPTITVLDETEQMFWEGCLSVPGLRGLVPRPRKIQVDYLDRSAKPQTLVLEDFLATVFQHELDHLAATLYVDKVRDTKNLAFAEEYQRFILPMNKERDAGD